MASTFSTNLALELIGTGDQAGTWGITTNTNLGTLIEQAISGYVTQAVATGTDTTITIPDGATGVARNMYIELTGTGGASTNLIVPANKKLYFIFNNTSSGQVTVKVSGQTGVSVPNKAKMVLVSNGTDIVNAANYVADFGSNSATITQLTSTSATITNLTLTSLVLSNLSIASANVTTLTSASATITNLLATSLTVSGNTFLATSSGNVGIGTSSPGAKLHASVTGAGIQDVSWLNNAQAVGANVGSRLVFTGTSSNNGLASIDGAFAGATTADGGYMTLSTRAVTSGTLTERARITSGGDFLVARTLGYNAGTYQSQKLKVTGGIGINSDSADQTSRLTLIGDSSTGDGIIDWSSTFNLIFSNNGTERARITSDGKFGLNTTNPQALLDIQTATGVNAIAMAAWPILKWDTSNEIAFGGYTANQWQTIKFYTAATERARIDSVGRLLVKTTTPFFNDTPNTIELAGNGSAAALQPTIYVKANTGTEATHTAYLTLARSRGTSDNSTTIVASGDRLGMIRFQGANGTGFNPAAEIYAEVDGTPGASNDMPGRIVFATTADGAGSSTERARITSGGDVGIGTGSPSSILHVQKGNGVIRLDNGDGNYSNWQQTGSDTRFGTQSAIPLIFFTNTNERARITSGGDLLVNTTTSYGRITAQTVDGSAAIGTIVSTAVNYNALDFRNSAGTQCGRILVNNAVTTEYLSASDRRLKENIAPADDAGSVIDSIEVVKHDWKVGGHVRFGVIAQDLHVVAPEAVGTGDTDDVEELKQPWGVDYSKLVPMLIKEVQSLRKRVAELENK